MVNSVVILTESADIVDGYINKVKQSPVAITDLSSKIHMVDTIYVMSQRTLDAMLDAIKQPEVQEAMKQFLPADIDRITLV